LAAYLTRSGLDCPPVPPDPRRSVGQYLLARDAGQKRFCHWLGDSAAHGLMREPAAVRQALDGADLVILGGDMLAVLPPAHRYELLALLADAKCPVALIPASRLGLWPDAKTARSVIAADRAAALATLVFSVVGMATWGGGLGASLASQLRLGHQAQLLDLLLHHNQISYGRGNCP
jgi:sugar/nucleoside kinase (ribokinase family)